MRSKPDNLLCTARTSLLSGSAKQRDFINVIVDRSISHLAAVCFNKFATSQPFRFSLPFTIMARSMNTSPTMTIY
eukprot:3665813-Amphidinium_carterae.1